MPSVNNIAVLVESMGNQDAEKVRQLRSRIVQTLNVPRGYVLRSSLAAALLDGLFEHPACPQIFSQPVKFLEQSWQGQATLLSLSLNHCIAVPEV